jgi:hypothetical protein
MPALVRNPSAIHATPNRSPAHLSVSSIRRNCTPMPSDTTIDGTMRLATAV